MSVRRAALSILSDILDRRQELDRVFDTHVRGLDTRDRALVRMMVATTLRHLRGLDALIDEHVRRKPDMALRHILRLGLTQLLLMDVGDHAALNETVSLVGQKKRGFINALLRGVQRDKVALSYAPPMNVPDWLYQEWVADYGAEQADLIATESAQQAKTFISNKNNQNSAFDGDVQALPEDSWVQDPSSAAAVPVLADYMGGLDGRHIVDACAAPGGKTMQLAAAGAQVIALDRSENRLQRLRDNLDRTGLSATVVCANLLKWSPPGPVDAILLDAPCSATGTIRRHPDLPWIKTQADLDKLESLQRRMLDYVAEWGVPILYATCSLQKREGEGQVAAFLDRHDHWQCAAQNRIFPSAMQDGFAIALLVPKA